MGYLIWVRETAAIKLHECISISKPKMFSLMNPLTLVCPVWTLLCKGNVSRNLPRCFWLCQCYVEFAREGMIFNRTYVTWFSSRRQALSWEGIWMFLHFLSSCVRKPIFPPFKPALGSHLQRFNFFIQIGIFHIFLVRFASTQYAGGRQETLNVLEKERCYWNLY